MAVWSVCAHGAWAGCRYPHVEPEPQKRRRGIPIVALLLTLAFPPLLGAASLVASDVSGSRGSRAVADGIERDTMALLDLFELRIALLDSENWERVLFGLDEVGGSSEIAETVIGRNPLEAAQTARAEVDRVLTRIGSGELRSAVDGHWAAATSHESSVASFERLETILSSELDATVDKLRAAAAASSNGAQTSASIEALAGVGEAQRSMASAMVSIFGSRFGEAGSSGLAGHYRLSLLSEALAYDAAAASFARSEPSAQLASAWRDLIMSAEFERYAAAITQDVQVLATGGSSDADFTASLSSSVTLFSDSSEVVEQHARLIDLAAADVRAASQDLSDAARADTTNTLLSMLLLVLVTAGVGLLVARLLVSPLRRLAAGAEMLEHGNTSERIPEQGPAELRDAARALNGAAATLDLVEAQARQLLDGSTVASEEIEATHGILGESVRSAMQALATSITEREELQVALAHEASHDGLTGLPNRTAMLTGLDLALERAQGNGGRVALMFLDLDGFKTVNDTLGHSAGDVVLTQVADRLRRSTRGNDVVGRLGGDEFLLIAEPVANVHEAQEIAQRLIRSVVAPIAVDGGETQVGLSIGIALSGPNGSDSTELLNAADRAVYEAKDDASRSIVVAGEVEPEVIAAG